MVDTSGSPYYNDAEHAIEEQYIEFLAIPGRVIQAREITQLQTIIRERQRRVADAIFDDGDIVPIACEIPTAVKSPLRISRDGKTYGIVLVEPDADNATKLQVRTNEGVKAIASLD